jgi:hypothetical protein
MALSMSLYDLLRECSPAARGDPDRHRGTDRPVPRAVFFGGSFPVSGAQPSVMLALSMRTDTTVTAPAEFVPPEDFADRTVAAVTAAWIKATARRPWLQLSEAERVDHLPSFLGHLLGVLFHESTSATDRVAMLKAAATHGEQRRRVGFDEATILHEYYLLRQIIWDRFRETFGAVAAEALIGKTDVEFSRATAASVRGFHRDALEAQGRWPTAIDELAERDAPPDPS